MFGYGYPANYTPPTDASTIPPKRVSAARRANGEYIRLDGEQVCKRLFGRWLIADWIQAEFGAWRETEDYPDGWVRL